VTLKFRAVPRAGIGEAVVVRSQIPIRHVVEKSRNAHIRRQLKAELEAPAEQRALRPGGALFVMPSRAPETAS
jgi:DNA integrity scanning protein DisA with diadenylate cyclase activity